MMNRCFFLPTISIQAILCQSSLKIIIEFHLQWLLLIVGEALLCHTIKALLTVEQIGSFIP